MICYSSRTVVELSSRKIAPLFLNQKRTLINRYEHGPLKRHNPDFPYLDWFKGLFTTKTYVEMKNELLRLYHVRVKELDKAVPIIKNEEETKIFEHFDTDESIKRWKPKADSDTLNGYSIARLTRSPQGHALFSGILDNRIPDDGVTMKSGFACIMGPLRPRTRAFQVKAYWDWSGYNQVELRVRGDGRRYNFVINTSYHNNDQTFYDNMAFHMYTRGGPYWETIRIPMSKFIFTAKNFVQDSQGWRDKTKVSFVAITLQDSYDGPFALEIDYIALQAVFTPYHEALAYEGYNHPHIRWRPLQIGADPPEH